MDNKRHMQRAAVDEIPVRVFAVFAQALAMIGKQYHQRRSVQPQAREKFEKGPERVVHVCQFLIVFASRCASAVGSGRVVGLVKVKKVDEEQKGAAGPLFNPALRAIQHPGGGPLQVERTFERSRVERAVVGLKS